MAGYGAATVNAAVQLVGGGAAVVAGALATKNGSGSDEDQEDEARVDVGLPDDGLEKDGREGGGEGIQQPTVRAELDIEELISGIDTDIEELKKRILKRRIEALSRESIQDGIDTGVKG